MSNKYVHGKNVEVFEWDGAEERLIICAKSCELRRTFDRIETAHWTSSRGKSYVLGQYDWSLSLSGITRIELLNTTDKTIFDYLLYGGAQTVRIRFSDGSGNSKTYEGEVLFPDMSITGDVASLSAYTMELQGSGDLNAVL